MVHLALLDTLDLGSKHPVLLLELVSNLVDLHHLLLLALQYSLLVLEQPPDQLIGLCHLHIQELYLLDQLILSLSPFIHLFVKYPYLFLEPSHRPEQVVVIVVQELYLFEEQGLGFGQFQLLDFLIPLGYYLF